MQGSITIGHSQCGLIGLIANLFLKSCLPVDDCQIMKKCLVNWIIYR
ncbi:hypothetical Protein YC6258_01670 [Gynuella sunshinyii YC6258]|uniref:Uncharacterized protein n=1 Tax=Gynuella sunshinyii YC6258 TaxID=1445510 RepID=A0A0C5VK25_9GAMM|nr:hypothetical Protein YC6258_01670 [Gynuella sunshinyii YC6258]